MTPTLQRKYALILLAGITTVLLLTAAVYWPGLSGSFNLDDTANISRAYIANPDWDAVVYTATHNGSGLLGRSVSMLSFVLTGLQYGLDPWGYKYHNLLLHLLNGVLLFRLVQLLLPALDRNVTAPRALLVAGVATSAWLLHPLLVSTVMYAVQRMTQLSVLFTLLALLAYVKARTSTRAIQFYVFGWCLFPLAGLLAVLAKENGALIPFYLLVIECFAFRPTVTELLASRRTAVMLGAFIVLPLVVAALALVVAPEHFLDYGGRTFTLQDRLLTQLHVLAFYVRLIVLPRIRDMSLFHDDYPVTTVFDMTTLALLLGLIALLVIVWRVRRTLPVVAFGISWFLVSHILESTVVPLEMVFEHRNYLASVGLLLIPVHLAFMHVPARGLSLLCPVVVALLAFMTFTRSREWGDDYVFHTVAVQEHPRSGRALNAYIVYLTRQRDYEGVVENLEKLMELSPAEAGVGLHLQSIKCATGTRDEAVLAGARELFAQYPVSVYGYNALQNLTMQVIEKKCPIITIADLDLLVDTALAYAMENTPARIAYLQRLRGLLFFVKGYYAQGYSDLRTAHEMLDDITVLHELMRFQLARREIGDAEETLALMEQQNARRLGIDSYQIDLSRQMLEREKAKILAEPRVAEAGVDEVETLSDGTMLDAPGTSSVP